LKEIKTKSVLKDIKALDKAADMSYRAKNAFIRTKEQAGERQRMDHGSYVEYAEDKIREGAKTVARETGQAVGRRVKKTVHMQVKQLVLRNAAPAQAREMVKRKYTLANELAKQRFTQSRAKARFFRNREMQAVETKTIHAVKSPFFKSVEKATWRITPPNVSSAGRTVKQPVRFDGKIVKEAAKGAIKLAQRSVKTAGHTAKAGIKTSQAAAKTAQAAQRAAQAARVTARAGAVSAKTATKAVAVTIKAIIAAVNGLVALIAAGGWMALVIILVICLAGLLSGSAFGIFFSNESYSPGTPIMTEIISQVNEEFAAEIQRIQDENPHDSLELASNGSSVIVGNWRDILAVYAVKVAADPENGREVATLDEAKVGILRDVFWDMNKIDYWLETVEHEESVTTILHIKVTSKSYANMIDEYGLNAQQVKMLNELMQEEYQQLFLRLTGGQTDIALSP